MTPVIFILIVVLNAANEVNGIDFNTTTKLRTVNKELHEDLDIRIVASIEENSLHIDRTEIASNQNNTEPFFDSNPKSKQKPKATFAPSKKPTTNPKTYPSQIPTYYDTNPKSKLKSKATYNPSKKPTTNPKTYPSQIPTYNDAKPKPKPKPKATFTPSKHPTGLYPSQNPTSLPLWHPTFNPSKSPTKNPNIYPYLNLTSLPSETPTFFPTESVAKTASSLLGNITVLPSDAYTINPINYGEASAELALTVVNASYVSEYIALDDTTSVLEAGRLQYMYFVVPPASTSGYVTGIGISFGDDEVSLTQGVVPFASTGVRSVSSSSSSLSLNVVPLTSSGVRTISMVPDGSTLYSLSIKTPAGICSTTTGEATQCTATTVNGYSITNTQKISSASTTNMNIACGNVCSLGSTPCSHGCSQCDAGSTVAGADTPVSRRFDMGTTTGSFSFMYQTYSMKDRITVWNDLQLIFDSGCVGTGVEVTKTISFDSYSQIIRVDAEPDCDCPGCTGTAWYFAASCPACMGVITSDGVEVQSGSDLFITSEALMPSIVAESKGCLSSESIQWTVIFYYECTGCDSYVRYDAGPFTGSSTIDLPLDVTALLSGKVYGGTMEIRYSGAASGNYRFTIKGINASRQVVRTYISSKTSLWFAIPMAIHESDKPPKTYLLHFMDDGTIKYAPDAGFGIFQLTNEPPTYDQIFSWKSNINEAVRRINIYVNAMYKKMSDYRDLAEVFNGGVPLPVPTRIEGLCTFEDGGSKPFEHAMAIKRYNGNEKGYYCEWKSEEWGFNPEDSDKNNYVNKVCARLYQ